MTDETLSAEPGEVPEAPIAAEQTDLTTDLQAELPEAASDEEGDEQQPVAEEEDLEDFEYEGKKVKLPKGMKDGFLRNADYTKKTQATAAKERELSERAQRIEEQSKMAGDELKMRVNLAKIEDQLEEYGRWTAADWQRLDENDPQLWNKHRFHYDALTRGREGLTKQISDAETKRTHDAKTAMSRRVEQAEAYAAQKGWKAEKLNDVVEFALGRGMSEHKMERQAAAALLESIASPFVLDLIDLARLGSQTLKNQASPKPPSAPTIAPLETVGAKRNPGTRDVNDPKLSMEEYVRIREAQIKAKGR